MASDILIVDDGADIRELVVGILQDEDHGTRMACDTGFRLIEVLSGCRETHSRYLWNTECGCRAGSKCAVVSAAPGGGLATLHLRNLSAVPGRSYGEWILHSKLHLPGLLAIHSAA
jgi:hypothetical protein